MTIRSFVSSLVVCVASLLLLASVVQAQNVTTWHNDNYRTGQQLNEAVLSPSTNWNNFGLLWQYSVMGNVYAQPLAVAGVSSPDCQNPTPCNMIFIATEQDMLYAFDANSSKQLWVANLATLSATNGGPFDCRTLPEGCKPSNSPIYPYIGVTGTPVIDPNAGILYVVALVQIGTDPGTVQYYLHGINISNGTEASGSPKQIGASVSGLATSPSECGYGTGAGPLTFDPTHHYQRPGLLLLNLSNGTPVIYAGFNPVRGEIENGWILGYTYSAQTPSMRRPVGVKWIRFC